MPVFIRSASCISPQTTFGDVCLLTDVIEYHDARLSVAEPDYSTLIDSRSLRRMSRIIRMGVAAAKDCLRQAEIEMPGAIVTGTAYGCMEASSSFLTSTIEQDEEDLSPTSFMQSTHNTVGAQIALMLKCHQYNNNFVHKGFSFESALQDATMLLNDNEASTVLTGGIDEMTEISFIILTRLGLLKRGSISNLLLFKSDSRGTIGGEGAAYFLLTSQSSAENMAELMGVQTFYKPADFAEIESQIADFLKRHSRRAEDIDLVITGKNGDPRNDRVYHHLAETVFNNVPRANYKHLCGDYPTSTSFALWLASRVIKTATVPDVIVEGDRIRSKPRTILIYNHYLNNYHSLILVSASQS